VIPIEPWGQLCAPPGSNFFGGFAAICLRMPEADGPQPALAVAGHRLLPVVNYNR
jgi:hypothetical protein